MIPEGSTIMNTEMEVVKQPSLTWKIDFEKGRIGGMIDGLEAVKQSASKILQTERFKYLIYSFNYGHELMPLIGRNYLYVQSEVNRIIEEALTQDDRIEKIENVQIDFFEDSITAGFTVVSIYGSFEQEVNI